MKNAFPKPTGSSLLMLALCASVMTGCRAKTSLVGTGNVDGTAGTPTQELPIVTKPVDAAPTVDSPFVITAHAIQSQVKAGTPIDLEIEVANVSAGAATLDFSSGQIFDFSATQEGEKTAVWSWAVDKMFSQALRSETVEAGKSKKFTAKWENAPAGRYSVQGKITANGGLMAAPFSVVVTP